MRPLLRSYGETVGENFLKKVFPKPPFKNFFRMKSFFGRGKKNHFFQKGLPHQNNTFFFFLLSVLFHTVIIFSGVFNLTQAWEKKEELTPIVVLQEPPQQNVVVGNNLADSSSRNFVVRKIQRIERHTESSPPISPKIETTQSPPDSAPTRQEALRETSNPSQPAVANVSENSLHRGDDNAVGSGQHAGGEGVGGRLTLPDASSGGGGTEIRSDWKKSYRRRVYSRIASAKRYPYSARRAGMEGKVVVRFTISREGELISVSVVQPCEYSLLNSDALEWVRRAAPFPPFPPEAEESSMSFTYSLRYELTEP